MAEEMNLNENIIAALGIGSLPEEQRIRMVNKMSDLIQKRVILRIMDSLSEEDAVEAEKLADKPEELLAFLGSKVSDISEIVAHETAKLKNELVTGVEAPPAEPSMEEVPAEPTPSAPAEDDSI